MRSPLNIKGATDPRSWPKGRALASLGIATFTAAGRGDCLNF